MREIQAFLAERYAVEVSPEFISCVTDAVTAEITAWQGRPLEPMYPVVFFEPRPPGLGKTAQTAVSRSAHRILSQELKRT